MKKLYILHLGLGHVGKEVKRQVIQQKKVIEKEYGVSITYMQKFTSRDSEEKVLGKMQKTKNPFVLIDTTASDKTLTILQKALKQGGFVVLANKKPLAGKQKDFDILHTLGRQRLLYECVVGAGLPVIKPLKDSIATGDTVMEIQGCFSGTLGFLFTELEKGRSFSEVVREAKEKGYTEPDPRDDLSGKDVARKALILARLCGIKVELEDMDLSGLYPKSMQKLSVENFLEEMYQLDSIYKEKLDHAKKKNKVLRFVAKVYKKSCRVGLEEIDRESDIGSLSGPDNIIVIKTKRYFDNPLVIKGPGAGIPVTAAGVFANVLDVAKIVGGEE